MPATGLEKYIEKTQVRALAGEFFVDLNADLILTLSNSQQIAHIGIQFDSEFYTVLGSHNVFFKDKLGEQGEIANLDILKILKNNSFKLGKEGTCEFVALKNGAQVWVMNGSVMTALWSIIQFIERSKDSC